MAKKHRYWREEDIEFIKNNHCNMTDKIIAVTLSKITGQNISIDMVRAQRRQLNLTKKNGRTKKN